MIDRDIAIVICSRSREDALADLLSDLEDAFLPALARAGLGASVFVYAQGYAPDAMARLGDRFATMLATDTLVLIPATRPHARIGDVVATAIAAVHGRARYRLAMLMDDDSVYTSHPQVDRNLAVAARRFIDTGARAYSIKLGPGTALSWIPFIDPAGPIMPFKEKMLWVSRPVLDGVLATPRFAELSIGEDAVIAAVAWLADPAACLGVHGIGTFLHIGYEAGPAGEATDLPGGYAALMNYDGPTPETAIHGKYELALTRGVTPHHVMPDVFVGEAHPHFVFNGIRDDLVARLLGPALDPA